MEFLRYNRVKFIVSNWYIRMWMISMPIFLGVTTFVDLHGTGSLWSKRDHSWSLIAFFLFFVLMYYVVNWYSVKRTIVSVAIEDMDLKDLYLKILKYI